MSDLYVIAEAAQGYLPVVGDRGSVDLALLLTRAAAAAGADAVKFQIVYVEELARPGNVHYEIFRRLEMPTADWSRVREHARERGVEFLADVFGPRSLEVARSIVVDGIKLHATTFFDHALVDEVVGMEGRTFVSIGGLEPEEVDAFVERHGLRDRDEAVLMYGFQAEPTPVASNHLARIPLWRDRSGVDVGFMDHADGAGPHWLSLSVMALALGVTVFEKHLTLDRELELEDFVSALPPHRFARYAARLREAHAALGSATPALTDAERAYREKALKRTVAGRDLAEGAVIGPQDIVLIRPEGPQGHFDPERVIGRTLGRPVGRGTPIGPEDLAT